MNEDQAKRNFVETNLVLLTSDPLDRRVFKDAHRNWFVEKLKKSCGTPGVKEIAAALIDLWIQRGFGVEKVNQYIHSLPFFTWLDENQRTNLLRNVAPTEQKSHLDSTDIELLRGGRAFEAVERHKGKEIAKRQELVLHALNEEVRLKQEEYDSLPSVLDEQAINEPDFDLEIEVRKSWWERFYLESNPFPRKDGLQAIAKEMYESVIVKTEPFVRLQNDLRKNPDFLFNTGFLLVGDFGFGKTTFLDYLEYSLLKENTYTLRVAPARAFTSATAYLDSFLSKLEKLAKTEVEQIYNRPQGDAEGEIEDRISFYCGLICDRKNGLVVVLDDYHKHSTQLAVVHEFLGMLQIIKDQFGRDGLKVGFIVSGTPNWLTHYASNSQLSGFLDSPPIVMPEITASSVADVFNRRIAAFCYDTSARTIQLEFVDRIFERTGTASYREYLNIIISELEQNNLAIVNSPIDISETELKQIQDILESDEGNAVAFRKLLHESKFKRYTSQQIFKCLEILVQIALRDGIAEGDRVFQENLFYFQRLKETSLLQKRKGTANAKFLWTIHSRLKRKTDDVLKRFDRSASDYLLKIYGGQSARASFEAIETAPKSKLAQLNFTLLPTSTAKKISDSVGIFESAQMASASLDQKRQGVVRMKHGITMLLEAVFELDETALVFRKANQKVLLDQALSHWLCCDEDIVEAIKRLNAINGASPRNDVERCFFQAEQAFQTIEPIIHELYRDVTDASRPFAFRHRASSHSNETLSLLAEVQEKYYSADPTTHFDYVRKIADTVESHIRRFLYVATNLAFGPKEYFEKIPESQRKEAYKNSKKREEHSSVFNHFNGLTRSQYRSIFCDKSDAKEIVTDQVDLKWGTDERRLFFDLLAEESIAASHNQQQVFSHTERNRYMKFCQLSEQFLSALNSLLRDIFVRSSTIQLSPNKSVSAEDCIFKIGMTTNRRMEMPTSDIIQHGEKNPLLFSDRLFGHSLAKASLDRVLASIENSLDSSSQFPENLLEIDYIEGHYGVSYVDFACSLIYGERILKAYQLTPWTGSSILVHRN